MNGLRCFKTNFPEGPDWLVNENYLQAIIVYQYLTSFQKDAIPILYKTTEQTRLGAQKRSSKLLYFAVKKNEVMKEVPLTRDKSFRGQVINNRLNLGPNGPPSFNGDVKVLDAITSWITIEKIDFNLKQSLLMGVYANMMEKGGNTALWEQILLSSSKKSANMIWDVLHGDVLLSVARQKGFSLPEVHVMEAITRSGIMTLFGGKQCFAELAKNFGTKINRLKNQMDIIQYTFASFNNFKISCCPTVPRDESKFTWSLADLKFWETVVADVTAMVDPPERPTKEIVLNAVMRCEQKDYIGSTYASYESNNDDAHDVDSPFSAEIISRDDISPTSIHEQHQRTASVITPSSANNLNQGLTSGVDTDLNSKIVMSDIKLLDELIRICDSTTMMHNTYDTQSEEVDWKKTPNKEDFIALVADDINTYEQCINELK